MPFIIDPARWGRIEALPVIAGLGNLKHGLCTVARIVYASTGKVSDMAPANRIAPTARWYLIALNDSMPGQLRSRLGTLAIAERVLSASTSVATEQKRVFLCADAAVRVFAPNALRAAGLEAEAETLATLAPITNTATAEVATKAAEAIAYVTAAARASRAVTRAAHAAAATYAAIAATPAAAATYAVGYAAWEPAFALLDALLAA